MTDRYGETLQVRPASNSPDEILVRADMARQFVGNGLLEIGEKLVPVRTADEPRFGTLCVAGL